jgi:hypothetical protein
MFKSLGKLFAGSKSKPADAIDSVLGRLRWSDDDQMWEAIVSVGDSKVGFFIAGDSVPSSALISHAHDIVRTLPDFKRIVTSFLADEATREKHLSHYADEIHQLAIEHVCLMWPDRPDDGMIYFHGPDQYRVWRCDYVARTPKGLGFDD